MLQGFTIPLLIGLGSEFIWGFNLLLPFPLNQPGILLARLTYTPYGRTVVHTIAAILVLALVSPVWDAYRLSTEAQPQIASAATNVQVSDQEAKTQLSMVLMLGSLGNLFFLRCLGRVMGDLSDLQTKYGLSTRGPYKRDTVNNVTEPELEDRLPAEPVQDRQEELVVEKVAPVLIEEVILEEPRKDL
ncbi:hypothetical protein ACKKBG_A11695 [Auxenochlorella protothecoides x Auxenochlorella symbiontica]